MADRIELSGNLPGDLPRRRLRAMAEAGEQILECYRLLRKSGANVVSEVLRGQGQFFEWDHYPKGDVYDPETHAQYYYHAHPAELRAGEHGHFHCFLRPKGMPAGVRPAPVPDAEPARGDNDALSHLIAISMNRAGYPIRIFTTNRWVTGETWYRADDVIRMLDAFVVDMALPSPLVNLWITGMLRLFRPQIEDLVYGRDAKVCDHETRQPEVNVYEDRTLEITSVADILVENQIAAVGRTLGRTRPLAAAVATARPSSTRHE